MKDDRDWTVEDKLSEVHGDLKEVLLYIKESGTKNNENIEFWFDVIGRRMEKIKDILTKNSEENE